MIGSRLEGGVIDSALNGLKAPRDELHNLVRHIDSAYGKMEECAGHFCIRCELLSEED